MPKQYSTLITCNHCGVALPHESYRFNAQGQLQHGRTCLSCNRKRQMARYLERAKESKTAPPPTVCSVCQQELPLSAFAKEPSTRTGYNARCRSCVNAKRQPSETYRWFKEYKRTKSCIVCGESEPCCLEFHHLDPREKEGGIAHMAASGTLGRLKKELDKCVVYCSNCHKKHHAGILKVQSVGNSTDWHLHQPTKPKNQTTT